MIYQQVTLSGDAEWPKVADAVIEAPKPLREWIEPGPRNPRLKEPPQGR